MTTPVDISVLHEILAWYDAHPEASITTPVPEQIARELLRRREAEEHDWGSAGHPAGDDTVCTRCGAEPDSEEDARPCPGGDVDREHHMRVARSRRRWIDAATSVLGPDWNGGPDDLRRALVEREGIGVAAQVRGAEERRVSCDQCGRSADASMDGEDCLSLVGRIDECEGVLRSAAAVAPPVLSPVPESMREAVSAAVAAKGQPFDAERLAADIAAAGESEYGAPRVQPKEHPWEWDPSECKVCANTPREPEGEIEHGRGCCVVDENGGGTSYADRVCRTCGAEVVREGDEWRCPACVPVIGLPPYACKVCGASGVKLWRKYQVFLDHQSLFCMQCALIDQKKTGAEDGIYPNRSDQIGWLVPAVPTVANDTYWGYTSVPKDRVDWWHALPDARGDSHG